MVWARNGGTMAIRADPAGIGHAHGRMILQANHLSCTPWLLPCNLIDQGPDMQGSGHQRRHRLAQARQQSGRDEQAVHDHPPPEPAREPLAAGDCPGPSSRAAPVARSCIVLGAGVAIQSGCPAEPP
jgi:hypothetical protein